ncbi:WXG100 family type VII secretion target [Krasilnikovia cinnamomea]|uniref:WXG100 family type VII secretion target n=1 Tax=Krasilnikovia cinnamomea TaxID=349313 RepID=A0A4Q7ZS74_9ACTN|nr:WXG100 family type VII secretion target [Krasilnikovia cinnamomea]RZU53463.1 WXG100 family type VII secretion target [Krasilnikovia cinnamomea]
MSQPKLEIHLDELRAALADFHHYQGQAEQIRKTVDGSIRNIGGGWWGEARTAYDHTIQQWLGDYQSMVSVPLENLIAWFNRMIKIMEHAEATNTKS